MEQAQNRIQIALKQRSLDSIDRGMMFDILRHYGVPKQIVDAIHVLYDQSKSTVYVGGHESKTFDVTTGVLQGDVLAPFLFIIVIDYISKKSAMDFGLQIHQGASVNASGRVTRSQVRQPARKNSDLAFADDIVLLESNPARTQQQLYIFGENAGTVSLEVHPEDKTGPFQSNSGEPNSTANDLWQANRDSR